MVWVRELPVPMFLITLHAANGMERWGMEGRGAVGGLCREQAGKGGGGWFREMFPTVFGPPRTSFLAGPLALPLTELHLSAG